MLHRILAVVSLTTFALAGCGVQIDTGSDDDPAANADDQNPAETPTQKKTGSSATPGGASPPSSSSSTTPTTGVPTSPLPAVDEPPTALSPFRAANELTYQKPIAWTIGAFNSDTVIRFTTDGSAPNAESPNATGLVTLTDLTNGTHIQWIAGGSSVVHDFIVHVDSTLSNETHSIVDNLRFDASDSPIVHVQPGESINGQADAAIWNGETSCPTCIDQITLGIDSAETCLVSLQPSIYPGSNQSRNFMITAPTTPGVYKLKTGFEQEFHCSDAIGHPLKDTEVGTIIVDSP